MPRLISQGLLAKAAIRCLLAEYFGDPDFVLCVKTASTCYRELYDALETEAKRFLATLWQPKLRVRAASSAKARLKAILVGDNRLLVTGAPDKRCPSNVFARHKLYTMREFLEPLADFLPAKVVQAVELAILTRLPEGQREKLREPQISGQFDKVRLTYRRLQSFIENEAVPLQKKWQRDRGPLIRELVQIFGNWGLGEGLTPAFCLVEVNKCAIFTG